MSSRHPSFLQCSTTTDADYYRCFDRCRGNTGYGPDEQHLGVEITRIPAGTLGYHVHRRSTVHVSNPPDVGDAVADVSEAPSRLDGLWLKAESRTHTTL